MGGVAPCYRRIFSLPLLLTAHDLVCQVDSEEAALPTDAVTWNTLQELTRRVWAHAQILGYLAEGYQVPALLPDILRDLLFGRHLNPPDRYFLQKSDLDPPQKTVVCLQS